MVSVVYKGKTNGSLSLQGHLCQHSHFLTFTRRKPVEEKDLVAFEAFTSAPFLSGMNLYHTDYIYLSQYKDPQPIHGNSSLDDIILLIPMAAIKTVFKAPSFSANIGSSGNLAKITMSSISASIGGMNSSSTNNNSSTNTQDLVIQLKSHQRFHFYFSSNNDMEERSFYVKLLQSLVAGDFLAGFTTNLKFLKEAYPRIWGDSSTFDYKFIDRSGDYLFQRWKCPDSDWRISEINKSYQFSISLPAHMIVPLNVHDRIMIEASSFRNDKRIPVLAYYLNSQKSCLIRSGQPLAGIKVKRSVEDELIVRSYFGISKNVQHVIVDARTKANASNAKNRNGGTEIDLNYGNNVKVLTSNIESASTIQEYYEKFLEVLRNPDLSTGNFLNDTSPYLKQIQSVLRPSIYLAKVMFTSGVSGLVHCEDGFDVTSIVCALVKVQLDPFYRTLNGFLELIEEDFSNFGFKYMERLGQTSKSIPRSTEVSYGPSFTLFLDAVWHITQQYASAFEFNESYLWAILEAACCGIYGEFNCNSVLDRRDMSGSFLSFKKLIVDPNRSSFINPAYDLSRHNDALMAVNASSCLIKVWSSFYDPQNRDQWYLKMRQVQNIFNNELRINDPKV